ncbi:HEAT repeat protein [Histoplasma capsulatum var. duboisii H88]|uniref:HEAT repeat protein n=1 Tax=Ajellomyces capsulatus (strain H88) TaxID=544711 RepID=A0A8A1LJ57_AJEC8|nr:HEAT repeat protein [Histoplasma capsulatum var. duboisii H88]
MEDSRQRAFSKLRPPCVELSSVGLKFRGDLATSKDVLRALEPLHTMLLEVASEYGLDEKLAEYAFFPLSHIFNETQRVSVRCLELALRCLQILIEKGWRQNLSVKMGKQLLILLTIIAGGPPTQIRDRNQRKPESEELTVAAFDCIATVCQVLVGPTAAAEIFNEIGTSTIVDQTVYLLLEGITDGTSDQVQLAAARALRTLTARVTHRVVLASLLPRSVSALTKALQPTTQMRRSYQVLCCCIQALTEMLKAVLNDTNVSAPTPQKTDAKTQPGGNTLVLDDSWLNATASQVKLALGNVIQLRTHDRHDVRHSLLELCLMVIEQCPKSLGDSLSMMVETVVVLAEYDTDRPANDAYVALKHLTISSSRVLDLLKSNMYTWTIALPRMMQSNNDAAKQRAIRQISTAFQVLSQTQPSLNILDDTLATSLCESVSMAIRSTSTAPQPLPSFAATGSELRIVDGERQSISFQPVLLDHRSHRRTLSELQFMISKLSATDTSLSMASSMLKKIYGSSGDDLLAPFWLTLSLIKCVPADLASMDDMIDLDSDSPSRSAIIEELYSISLPILTDLSTANPHDWRLPALALEAIALQAQQLGETFRPELIDTLYPVLQLMGSSNPNMQNHAVTCLDILTAACRYPNTSSMLVDNVDYLVNSVSLKLNTFDISPQAPQVLLMMTRLCGASLIPYLDDLVGSIFTVLDAFHGYPKLVELLFSVLGAIVDEGAKKPAQLAITGSDTNEPVNHRKRPLKSRRISDIANEFQKQREKRARASELEAGDSLEKEYHPRRPWASERDGLRLMDEDESDIGSESEGLPPPTTEEKTLSRSHTLLLNIAKSIPPHLSSPSPFLRRSLLTILTRALPILAHDENTFLPLINDLWPSVSARITTPQTLSPNSAALTTPHTGPAQTRNSPASIDESGIQEEAFVISASCSAIGAMCEGAGDFMASRIEHEFPRWKKLYLRAWERVRQDSERAAERQRQRIEQQEHLNSRTVSGMESLTPDTDSKTKIPDSTTSVTARSKPPPPPPPPPSTKSFTPHNSLFQALTRLFTTILHSVYLSADIRDEIFECLGTAISFFQPDYYFTYAWREHTESNDEKQIGKTAGEPRAEATSRTGNRTRTEEFAQAIQAMHVLNADLTWFIFEKGRQSRGGIDDGNGDAVDRLARVGRNIERRIADMLRSQLHSQSDSPTQGELRSAGSRGSWRLAEVIGAF